MERQLAHWQVQCSRCLRNMGDIVSVRITVAGVVDVLEKD
jgi:hypothetical protein